MNSRDVTIGRAIADVIDLLKDPSGEKSVQNGLSEEFIYYKLLSYRAISIDRKLMSGEPLNDNMYQTIPKIKMKPEDMRKGMVSTTKKIITSEYTLPATLKVRSITSIDGAVSMDMIDWEDLDKIEDSRHAWRRLGNYAGFKIEGSEGIKLKAYISTDIKQGYDNPLLAGFSKLVADEEHKYDDDVDCLAMTAAFYDPLEVQLYNFYEGKIDDPCKRFTDYLFFTDPQLLPIICEATANAIRPERRPLPDYKNDGQDGTVEPTRPK